MAHHAIVELVRYALGFYASMPVGLADVGISSNVRFAPGAVVWMRSLTAVTRYFVLALDCEQVVTKKAARLHCHSVPRSGSDTTCGRPTATAAPAATIATAAIASVLDLCQMNFMGSSDFRGLESAL